MEFFVERISFWEAFGVKLNIMHVASVQTICISQYVLYLIITYCLYIFMITIESFAELKIFSIREEKCL